MAFASDKTTTFTEGLEIIADGDNAVTEEQMQSMFEEISKICKDCYPSPGYSYT